MLVRHQLGLHVCKPNNIQVLLVFITCYEFKGEKDQNEIFAQRYQQKNNKKIQNNILQKRTHRIRRRALLNVIVGVFQPRGRKGSSTPEVGD